MNQERIDTVKFNDVEYVRKDQIKAAPKLDGDYVIVRCRNAGVHAGILQSRSEGVLKLVESRRLWRWWSKFTLSELAMTGVLNGKESECQFSCVVPAIDLTCSDIAEVLYCTTDARESIEGIAEYTNA